VNRDQSRLPKARWHRQPVVSARSGFADGVAGVARSGGIPSSIRTIRRGENRATDEMCRSDKDIYDDTRSNLRPAGLGVAGIKKY